MKRKWLEFDKHIVIQTKLKNKYEIPFHKGNTPFFKRKYREEKGNVVEPV